MPFPVEITRVEPEPRNLHFWENRLSYAQTELEKLAKFTNQPPKYPARPDRRMTPPERVKYRKAVQTYHDQMCGIRQRLRHLKMLQETKIPYYEARILALRRTLWQRLGDDFLRDAEA